MKANHVAAHRGRGLSLVEVLVAVTVLALGVLSVVALQLVSKRANMDSAARSMASQLAYDIIERMRVNNSTVALGEYLARSGIGIGRGQQTTPTKTCSNSTSDACNGAQLADYEVWQFEQSLDGAAEAVVSGGVTTNTGGVVSPTACISGPAGGISGIYTLTIAWRSAVPLPINAAVTCGAGLGLYGSSTDECASVGADDCLRQVVQVQTYINAN